MATRRGRRNFPTPLPNGIQLGPFDVISGKGVTRAQHPGNERFRALIRVCADRAYKSYTTAEKQAMAVEIIQHIEEMGGRFLKKVAGASRGLEGPWEVLSEEERFKKTKQALRDCNRSDREGYAHALNIPQDVQRFLQNILSNSATMKEHFAKAAARAQRVAEVHAATERQSSGGSFHAAASAQPSSSGSFVSPASSGPPDVASLSAETPACQSIQPPVKKQKVTPTPAAATAASLPVGIPFGVYAQQSPVHLSPAHTQESLDASLSQALSQHEQQAAVLSADLQGDPQNQLTARDFVDLHSAFADDESREDDAKEAHIEEDSKPSAAALAANLAAIEGNSSLPGFSGSPLRQDDDVHHGGDDGVLDPGSLF